MSNTYRGEITADLGGRRRTLVLTLGALAELESALARTISSRSRNGSAAGGCRHAIWSHHRGRTARRW
jgi:hypothetical protein